MKKCIFCTAELEDNQTRCDYCGKEQDGNQSYNIAQEIKNNNEIYNYQDNLDDNKKNKVIRILLIISIILCCGACFLPYISIEGLSMNYVFFEKKTMLSSEIDLKDGVFVIIFGIISILTLLIGKKRIPPLIFQLLSLGVFALDYFDMNGNVYYKLVKELYNGSIFGIGFYLVLIFLIISVALSLVRVIKKDKYD